MCSLCHRRSHPQVQGLRVDIFGGHFSASHRLLRGLSLLSFQLLSPNIQAVGITLKSTPLFSDDPFPPCYTALSPLLMLQQKSTKNTAPWEVMIAFWLPCVFSQLSPFFSFLVPDPPHPMPVFPVIQNLTGTCALGVCREDCLPP